MRVNRKWALGIVIGIVGCGGDGNDPSSIVAKSATVVAGGPTAGADDGSIVTATFRNPVNVAADSDGTVYVCDFDNDVVRAISDGQVRTLVDQANFTRPFGITLGEDGTLYVQTDANDDGARDASTGTVWRVDKRTGVATVVARNLGRPRGILGLPDGRIAMANLTRSTIEILNPGTGAVTPLAGQADTPGFAEGTGAAAQFDRPYGMALDGDGSLLVADQNNHRIRRVTLAGVVTTFAGTGTPGGTNGAVGAATFNGPQDVDRAPNGRIYVADTTGHLIRMIRNGQVTTFAGDGTAGFADGSGQGARFFGLEGMAIAPNGRNLYVADGSGGTEDPYHRVRFFKL
ncbi:MAG: SMP-30/gluconolactonase/LRE family protein [Fimbriimonas sp.]